MIARILSAAALSLMAQAAGAGVTIGYADGDAVLFQVEAPDGWRVNTGVATPAGAMPDGRAPKPRIVSLMPPEEEPVMWAGMWAPPQLASLDDAGAYLESLQLDLLDAPRITDDARRTVAGMPARVLTGEGARDGAAFVFTVAMVQIAPDRVAVAAFIGQPEAQRRYDDDLAAVLASLQGVAR